VNRLAERLLFVVQQIPDARIVFGPLFHKSRGVAGHLPVGERNLEGFAENVLVPVLGCCRPFLGTDPGVDIGWLHLVGHMVAEGFENVLHPALEVTNILAVVIDIPGNRLLGYDLKSNAFVFHVRGQLHAAKRIRLPEFVQLDRVAATTRLLASLPAIDVVANTPDARARPLLENSSLFANHFSWHGFGPPRPKIANQVQTGTRTGTRAVWTTKAPPVVRGSCLCKLLILIVLSLVPRGGLEPPRPCGLRILSPLRLPISPSGHALLKHIKIKDLIELCLVRLGRRRVGRHR
jgi:hypothetical protein